ncbi:5-formyltetrahydrofolate cyclo-ligase [Paenibacillus sp. SYP-B4298]|uniref:5-formyltetrahydrofolate cyclo-ligase n=1 Tax=Paenibacillus sp. SYP-B4298 TaxID=2996034 RepID=UPI0022DE0CA2|nr:5-formyltetrahydrofolate cyclo-ligase [Paenibacillus sp. SYP-B4298]
MENHAVHGRKQELRRQLGGIRDSLAPQQRSRWSEAACAAALTGLERMQASTVLVYISFRSEVDTMPLIQGAWKRGIEVAAPRCMLPSREMELYRITSLSELRQGAYGIMEPDPKLAWRWPPERIPDVVLVPGLAFSKEGGRLGYGGGYYDRYYSKLLAGGVQPLPRWLGLSFEAQLIAPAMLPLESHDLRLDAVVTECRAYPADWAG